MKLLPCLTLTVLLTFVHCSYKKEAKQEGEVTLATKDEKITYLPMQYEIRDSLPGKLCLIIDYDLGNSLIIGYNTVKGLQQEHNNAFEVEEACIYGNAKPLKIYRLRYKNSYIKVYYNDFEGVVSKSEYDLSSNDLVCAVIADKEIRMQNGIHIEMSKDDFGAYILTHPLSPNIDTIQAADETGDIEWQFVFEDEKLKTARATSTYDFADFRFHHQ